MYFLYFINKCNSLKFTLKRILLDNFVTFSKKPDNKTINCKDCTLLSALEHLIFKQSETARDVALSPKPSPKNISIPVYCLCANQSEKNYTTAQCRKKKTTINLSKTAVSCYHLPSCTSGFLVNRGPALQNANCHVKRRGRRTFYTPVFVPTATVSLGKLRAARGKRTMTATNKCNAIMITFNVS